MSRHHQGEAKAEGSTITHKAVLEVVKSVTQYVYNDKSNEVKAEVAMHIKEVEEVHMSDIQDQDIHMGALQQYQE